MSIDATTSPPDSPYVSLVQDILILARHGNVDHAPDEVAAAAGRVLSAHHNDGLPRVLLGQAAGRLESRLVQFLRQEAQGISEGRGKGPDED